ncbi:MAG TPA: Txe/YoeB family addiction module toxin [Hanamia sp.]
MHEVRETPYEGSGRPEPLKYELSGKWSRRITHEHRMVYSVTNNIVEINSLKGHYDKK